MDTPVTHPTLKRRFSAMLYESMLLFGVLFIAAYAFSVVFEQKHALYMRHALEAWLFFVLGVYFTWFWQRNGQTLAMQTWRIRLVTTAGERVSYLRAFGRYLLSWLWFLPGLMIAKLVDAEGWMLVLIPLANMVLWTLAVNLDPKRQFLHDRIAGTMLVNVPKEEQLVTVS